MVPGVCQFLADWDNSVDNAVLYGNMLRTKHNIVAEMADALDIRFADVCRGLIAAAGLLSSASGPPTD